MSNDNPAPENINVEMIEALYAWLSLYHEGQFSAKYEMHCKLGDYFSLGPMYSESRVEKNNQAFSDINEDNWEDIGNDLIALLESY